MPGTRGTAPAGAVASLAVIVSVGAAASLSLAGTVAAQETCATGDRIGDLGIRRLACDCTVGSRDDGRPRWDFRSLPRIVEIAPGSPADDALAVGDLIVSIDETGLLEPGGASRFASVMPGDRVELAVQRDGRRHRVTIDAGAVCSGSPDALSSRVPESDRRAEGASLPPVPRPAEPGTEGRPALVPTPPGAAPEGWFGFALACRGCGWAREAGDATTRWESSTPPVIRAVEPRSPAARAGLVAGDVLSSIDGLPITSRAGGTRLGAASPGERVRIGVLRDGAPIAATVEVGTRPAPTAPEPSGPTASAPSPAPDAVRYRGRVGDASIEVVGRPVTVIEDDAGRAVEIIVGDTRIRIRREPP